MARANIVTGELRNKVGAMVGSKWKGVAYVRAYTSHIKDANTAPQQAVRNTFRMITKFASGINESVLKPYQAKPIKNQSPYNYFVHINKEVFRDKSKGYESLLIFDGPLPVASGLQASASEATSNIEVSFTPLQFPEMCEDSDVLIIVVYNENNHTFGSIALERGSEYKPLTVSIPAYFAKDDTIHVYLTACQVGRINGGTTTVSITAGV
jgi:hypothetical protein